MILLFPDNKALGPRPSLACCFRWSFSLACWTEKNWYGVFDFTTLNGAFEKVVSGINPAEESLDVAKSAFRGNGGYGAMDGFLFAFGLIPAVIFALGMINVLEHYGALRAGIRGGKSRWLSGESQKMYSPLSPDV